MRRNFGFAWLALALALALHVADEAANGFLAVYNPTVTALRASLPWLPLPVFRFDVWLGGLIAAIVALVAVSPLAFRGARLLRAVAWPLAVLMVANALGHIAGTVAGRTVESVRFDGPMPGFWSSPLLLGASLYLMIANSKVPKASWWRRGWIARGAGSLAGSGR